MDYEQKYKEALERAAKLRVQNPFDTVGQMVEHIFPELKESEDERIRKKVIEVLKLNIKGAESQMQASRGVDRCFEIYACNKVIAWLEKQEEPKDKGEISDGYHTFNELYRYRLLYNAAFFNLLPKELVHKSKRHHDGEECFGGGWFIVMANLPTGQISNHYELKDWDLFQIPEKDVADKWDGHTPQEAADRLHKYLLEKQGEQSTDKVEPKFKVGDWITNGRYNRLVVGVDSRHYQFKNGDAKYIDDIDRKYHLWTIQNAKDGDVLVDVYGNIGIFDKCYDFDWMSCCSLGNNGGFQHFTVEHENEKTYPATEEQRNLFFSKMKEEGWEWDSENKELKKIESKILDADKVIEWIKTHGNLWPVVTIRINDVIAKFKEDFGL